VKNWYKNNSCGSLHDKTKVIKAWSG